MSGDQSAAWDDDRPGMMRVHVAQQRGQLACVRYTAIALRAFAKTNHITPPVLKGELADVLALHGHVDSEGHLREAPAYPSAVGGQS